MSSSVSICATSDDGEVMINLHQTSMDAGDGFDRDASSMCSKPQPYPLG
jgi:hypothetical protein